MRRVRQACRVLVGAAALAGCAPIPPPSVLSDVERARVSPQVTEAKDGAEAAMAKAESLRQRANEALASGDYAGAQILGEQALVAYEAVAMTARAAKALARAADATAETDAAERELAALEATLQQVRADVAALEGRLLSSQLASAQLASTQPAERAGAEPGLATSSAAKTAALASSQISARMSCMTADLLRRTHAPAESANAKLDVARKLLDASGDDLALARRSREACLAALDDVRRGLGDVKHATGGADALLEALSNAGLDPRRDERGVVVTVRGSFAGDALTAVGRSALEKLAKAAKPFAGTPLLLVVHEPLERTVDPAQRGEARGRLVSMALAADLGNDAIGATLHAGMTTPVVDPKGKHAARNQRVELVFVTRQAI